MRKATILLAALLLLISTGAFAQANKPGVCDGDGPHGRFNQGMGRGAGFGHGMGGRMGMPDGQPGIRHLLAVADEIELTDDQKNRLESMTVDFQTQRVDAQAEVKKAEITLRSLMRDDDASESAVLAAIDNVSRLKADLQKMRYQHRQQVKSVLTDEQQEKLKELRKDFGKRMFRRSGDDDDDTPPTPRGGRGMRGGR